MSDAVTIAPALIIGLCGRSDGSNNENNDGFVHRLLYLITMITPIAVCGTLDPGNERGMALGEVMLSRSLAALKTMECDQLLF